MTRIVVFLVVALLAGCANDPLRDVPRLSDADLTDPDAQAAVRADTDDAIVREDGSVTAPRAMPSETAEQPGANGGLLGFFRRAAEAGRTPEGSGSTEMAAAAPRSQASTGGVFGGATARGPRPGAPDYQIVPMGTALPYGTLARVCNVPDRQLGTRIDRYPENRNTYALYDTQPGSTAPHTFFVTGFDDGCARQFTAAVAIFGAPQMHEQLRYGLPSDVQPYSRTDAAYETLKSRICRVGKGKPCGSAMSRLARDTVFVSVYEQFGSNPSWKTILLNDGKVVETDIRSN